MEDKGVIDLLHRLTSIRTAPYNERGIAALITRIAGENGLLVSRDVNGNMLVTLSGTAGGGGAGAGTADSDAEFDTDIDSADGKRGPRLIFSAHMDHPAIEVVSVGGVPGDVLLEATPMGGFPVDVLRGGEELLLFQPGGGQGEPLRVQVDSVERLGDKAKSLVVLRPMGDWGGVAAGEGQTGWWAVPDFPPGLARQDNGELAMGAADDLAGCAVILATLISMARSGVKASVAGLFTRAEEVGLVGAMAAARDGFIPAHASVVVVETSKPVNGTSMGMGPIIRVGDKQSVFHGGMTGLLVKVAAGLVKSDSDFRYQRALLDGGRCEGTVFQLFGIPTGAISLPLHGYHNRDLENKRLVQESVHENDLACAVRLLVQLGLEFDDAVSSWEDYTEMELNKMLHQASDLFSRLRGDTRL